jgi:hypothetical protein
MESPSGFGRAGIRIRDCSLAALESRLVSVLESASLAGTAGDGTIGDLTGITITSLTTTTPTFRTAESLLITTLSITETSITAADFMVEADSRAAVPAEIPGSVDRPRSMDL